MKLIDVLNQANTITDESFAFSDAVHFINNAITKINVVCGAKYPIYTATDTNVILPLPDKWAQALLVPFVCFRIKQVDSSKFEFEAFYSEFLENLSLFEMKYTIPTEYVDVDSQYSYAPDFSENPMKDDWSKKIYTLDPLSE